MKTWHYVLMVIVVLVALGWAFNSEYEDQLIQQEYNCELWQLWIDTGVDGRPDVPDDFDKQCKDILND